MLALCEISPLIEKDFILIHFFPPHIYEKSSPRPDHRKRRSGREDRNKKIQGNDINDDDYWLLGNKTLSVDWSGKVVTSSPFHSLFFEFN